MSGFVEILPPASSSPSPPPPGPLCPCIVPHRQHCSTRCRFVSFVNRHTAMRSWATRCLNNTAPSLLDLHRQREAHLAFPAEYSASRMLGHAVRAQLSGEAMLRWEVALSSSNSQADCRVGQQEVRGAAQAHMISTKGQWLLVDAEHARMLYPLTRSVVSYR